MGGLIDATNNGTIYRAPMGQTRAGAAVLHTCEGKRRARERFGWGTL